ncbi:MAG: glucosaminidase domain-containing protein, partial [Alphaproteobacteria bacterium]|nr:glucosaminidase domain-containing protein [Alphaproteobacteria bacterium]
MTAGRRALGMVLAAAIVAGAAGPARAQAFRADTFDLCADAAAQVEAEEGIPAGLLGAIAMVETGRGNPFNNGRRSAWPWTVNIAGKGAHLDSKAEALRIVEGKLLDGVGLIDVGCF